MLCCELWRKDFFFWRGLYIPEFLGRRCSEVFFLPLITTTAWLVHSCTLIPLSADLAFAALPTPPTPFLVWLATPLYYALCFTWQCILPMCSKVLDCNCTCQAGPWTLQTSGFYCHLVLATYPWFGLHLSPPSSSTHTEHFGQIRSRSTSSTSRWRLYSLPYGVGDWL